MAIGDTLPEAQQRLLPYLVIGFKITALSGLAALGIRLLGVDLLSSILGVIHAAVSYTFATFALFYFVLHFGYAMTLRGGFTYTNTKVSGFTVVAFGALVVAVAVLLRPDIADSPLGLSSHVLAAMLIPMVYQRHVIRAMSSRGN